MSFKTTYAVRLKTAEVKERVIQAIKDRDSDARLDPEGNPVTFWITTRMDERDIEALEGVDYVITVHSSYNWPCPCGSGEPSSPLSDARGIPLGRVCDKCEEEFKAKYRPEIFEDSNYEADEAIEPEDY